MVGYCARDASGGGPRERARRGIRFCVAEGCSINASQLPLVVVVIYTISIQSKVPGAFCFDNIFTGEIFKRTFIKNSEATVDQI